MWLFDQAWPLAPQLAALVLKSTHEPLQLCCGAAQERVQTPACHNDPAAQTAPALLPAPALAQVPVAPQWVRLVAGSVQVPPQSISPAWQLSAHTPPLHICPAAQTVPALLPLPVAVQLP